MSELASEPTNDAATPADVLSDEVADTELDAESSASEAAADTSLPLDKVFTILKNKRRRRVLEHLQDSDGTVSLSDLAEEIAALENDKPVKQITSSERKRVYVGLYQCHLPKMDSMDVISFNKPRGHVELGENVGILYEYLDTINEPEPRPWHYYSLGLSVAGAGFLTAALVVEQFVAVPVVTGVVGVTIVALLLYALVGFEMRRRERAGDD